MPGPTHFRESFREFKPDPTKYYVHKVRGYWQICLPHPRYQPCGNHVLWDGMEWVEAMALVNQVGILAWAGRYSEQRQKGCWV